MKEINIGQATALTSPDPLVLVCTRKEDGGLNMAPGVLLYVRLLRAAYAGVCDGKSGQFRRHIRRTAKRSSQSPALDFGRL